MRLIRDDAPQKLAHAQTLLLQAGLTESVEMRTQHLQRVNDIIEQLLSSMKDNLERTPDA